MGKLKITPGGGGGVASGDTTVTRDKVPSGLLYLGADTNDDIGVGTMPERTASIITPTTTNQIISAGQRLAGDQTILGDPNLRPENIKKGVPIFGKTGSFQGYVDSPLYLFNNGTWTNVQTTGITAITVGSIVDNTSSEIGIHITDTSRSGIGRINQAIDLSAYNFIKMEISAVSRQAYGLIGVSTSPTIQTYTSLAAYTKIYNTTGTIILDVSSLGGNYYIYLGAEVGGYTNPSVSAKGVFLSTT